MSELCIHSSIGYIINILNKYLHNTNILENIYYLDNECIYMIFRLLYNYTSIIWMRLGLRPDLHISMKKDNHPLYLMNEKLPNELINYIIDFIPISEKKKFITTCTRSYYMFEEASITSHLDSNLIHSICLYRRIMMDTMPIMRYSE